MTPEMAERVRALAHELRTQDIRATDQPVFMVQRRVRDRWENCQPFLTEAGAKEYIRINGHNLGETRIYAEGSYRNAEWRFMRELILALAPEEVSRG